MANHLEHAKNLPSKTVAGPNGEEITLYRIRALVDLPAHGVHKGQIGGFAENLNNITGQAWLGGASMLFGNATMTDAASLWGTSQLYGNATMSGTSSLHDRAKGFSHLVLEGNATMQDDSKGYGHARIGGNSSLRDSSIAAGNVVVQDNAVLAGDSRALGNLRLCGTTILGGKSVIGLGITISGESLLYDVKDWMLTNKGVCAGQEISNFVSVPEAVLLSFSQDALAA